MHLECQKINDVNVIFFHDKQAIHSDQSEAFKNRLKELIVQAKYKAVLDCENLDFVDSSGISALISCYKMTLHQNGYLYLIHLSPSVYEIFKLIKLDKIFKIFKNLDEILQSKAC